MSLGAVSSASPVLAVFGYLDFDAEKLPTVDAGWRICTSIVVARRRSFEPLIKFARFFTDGRCDGRADCRRRTRLWSNRVVGRLVRRSRSLKM